MEKTISYYYLLTILVPIISYYSFLGGAFINRRWRLSLLFFSSYDVFSSYSHAFLCLGLAPTSREGEAEVEERGGASSEGRVLPYRSTLRFLMCEIRSVDPYLLQKAVER